MTGGLTKQKKKRGKRGEFPKAEPSGAKGKRFFREGMINIFLRKTAKGQPKTWPRSKRILRSQEGGKKERGQNNRACHLPGSSAKKRTLKGEEGRKG